MSEPHNEYPRIDPGLWITPPEPEPEPDLTGRDAFVATAIVVAFFALAFGVGFFTRWLVAS